MTWVFIPGHSTTSPSAPAAADWTSASNWRCRTLAQRFTWRGKLSPAATWSKRCERVEWLQRLCGAMPEPSQAAASVDLWISSLAASRVSPTASPESGSARKTSATSGPRPGASSPNAARGSSSSRTSAACSPAAAPIVYGETYSGWVSRLREDCSQRRKLARRTRASASSSSGSVNWPTPASGLPNDGEEPETWRARAATLKDKHQNGNGAGVPLAIAAKELGRTVWPPPRTITGGGESAERKRELGRDQSGGGDLQSAVTAWPTPAARDYRSPNSQDSQDRRNEGSARGQQLPNFVAHLWSTPRASDAEKGGPNQSFGAGGTPLPAQTSHWPTPIANDSEKRGNVKVGAGLAGASIAQPSFPPAPETSTPGAPSSPPDPTSLRLSPSFVEWMMGWPPEWTAFGCSEMELYLYKRLMRSELSQLASHDAPPAQLALFG
jgi:hypothetical protein